MIPDRCFATCQEFFFIKMLQQIILTTYDATANPYLYFLILTAIALVVVITNANRREKNRKLKARKFIVLLVLRFMVWIFRLADIEFNFR